MRKNPNIPAEWIDEIPVQPSKSKAATASLATAMLALLAYGMWVYGGQAFDVTMANNGTVASLFGETELLFSFYILFYLIGMVGSVCLFAGLFSLIRNRISYSLLRSSLLVVYPVMLVYVFLVWKGVFAIVDNELIFANNKYDTATGLILWWKLCWPALAIIFYVFWLHLLLSSRSVYAAFTGNRGEAMEGDRALEDWRTHGKDPRARKSLYWSILTHVTVIIIIPMLLEMRGCVEPYKVPKGSGQPQLQVVVQKVKKPKKKKKLKLRKNSAFIYEIPDIFEKTDTTKLMEEATAETHVANATPGKLGAGGGKKGGWPEGMENAVVRFIRLKHSGRGWDDGMNQTEADSNFLYHFHKATGFKTRRKGESHDIGLLAKYEDDSFPPFVYLTGNDRLGNISGKDMEILREYCLKGGMLIADAGSNHFDRSFRDLMRRVFPAKPMRDIADDDVIYQQPNRFANGAPSFWHHGGSRAMGIKHEGRWIVYYHPGDMNDAWKSAGYSDVTPVMRKNAMDLGINLVYYAFNQWNDAVAKLRK